MASRNIGALAGGYGQPLEGCAAMPDGDDATAGVQASRDRMAVAGNLAFVNDNVPQSETRRRGDLRSRCVHAAEIGAIMTSLVFLFALVILI